MNISTTAKVQQIVTNDHSVSVTLVTEKPKLTLTIVAQGNELDNVKRGQHYSLDIVPTNQTSG